MSSIIISTILGSLIGAYQGFSKSSDYEFIITVPFGMLKGGAIGLAVGSCIHYTPKNKILMILNKLNNSKKGDN